MVITLFLILKTGTQNWTPYLFCKIDSKKGYDETSGTFQVLDNNVLMLVRSSSGEHTFYKVKDANNVVLTDSLGNEPKGETAKLYVLKKK